MSLVKNLVKSFGSTPGSFQMNIPHLEWEDKGITVIKGPSGSGKSTLFRCLLGLEDCPQMIWQMGELQLQEFSPGERNIGVVFQDYCLYPHMTVQENILFSARSRRLNKTESQKRLAGLTERLALDSCLNRKVSKASGGEKQRTALARALITHPRYLFLDEPFSALDANLRNRSRELVKSIVEEMNIPALLITHDQEDVDQLADRVFEISEGKIVKP